MNRKTVVRKFLFLAKQARMSQQAYLLSLKGPVSLAQFDEMESFEHSKCLPVSIPLVVEVQSRKILGFRVCSMPAKGPLARVSLRKYGPRADNRRAAALELFESLTQVIHPQAQITSDQNPKYPNWIKPSFPAISHKTVKGRRGCVVGQGELKRIGHDPLFDLNHTCAMLRANINRLARRTWCTSKRADRLADHIAIYVHFHNQVLT